MARGWESKSVEDQIGAAAADKDGKAERTKPRLTAAERDRQARRENLLLAKVKTARDLAAAHDGRYRAMLEQALAHLDAELRNLERS